MVVFFSFRIIHWVKALTESNKLLLVVIIYLYEGKLTLSAN